MALEAIQTATEMEGFLLMKKIIGKKSKKVLAAWFRRIQLMGSYGMLRLVGSIERWGIKNILNRPKAWSRYPPTLLGPRGCFFFFFLGGGRERDLLELNLGCADAFSFEASLFLWKMGSDSNIIFRSWPCYLLTTPDPHQKSGMNTIVP